VNAIQEDVLDLTTNRSQSNLHDKKASKSAVKGHQMLNNNSSPKQQGLKNSPQQRAKQH